MSLTAPIRLSLSLYSAIAENGCSDNRREQTRDTMRRPHIDLVTFEPCALIYRDRGLYSGAESIATAACVSMPHATHQTRLSMMTNGSAIAKRTHKIALRLR